MQAAGANQSEASYLDIQAEVGITKHIGGFDATDALLALCRVETAKEILYVGCGIGVGPVYIARKFGCRVVAVDISEKMLAWARRRAREAHVEEKVECRPGNILDLPFEDNRFDAVLVESVVVFVDDKARAIRECARVTRRGGYVGLNEVFWAKPATSEVIDSSRREIGAAPLSLDAWQTLWRDAGLEDKQVKTYEIDARAEIRGRVQWVGLAWALRAIGRLIVLYLTNPNARRAVKEQWGGTLEKSSSMGYGLFIGRKA
jgi:arsenite methyltransferase